MDIIYNFDGEDRYPLQFTILHLNNPPRLYNPDSVEGPPIILHITILLTLTTLNLSDSHNRCTAEMVILRLLIFGPKKPKIEDAYHWRYVDDAKDMYQGGVRVYDAGRKRYEVIYSILLGLVADYPGLCSMGHMFEHGHCPKCKVPSLSHPVVQRIIFPDLSGEYPLKEHDEVVAAGKATADAKRYASSEEEWKEVEKDTGYKGHNPFGELDQVYHHGFSLPQRSFIDAMHPCGILKTHLIPLVLSKRRLKATKPRRYPTSPPRPQPTHNYRHSHSRSLTIINYTIIYYLTLVTVCPNPSV